MFPILLRGGKLRKKGSKYFTTKDERQRGGYGIIRIDGIVEKIKV